MKLEVGMFIRTPLGIDKLKEDLGSYFLTEKEGVLRYNLQTNYISIDGECFDKEEIKASHNIIDLIEVGDYVNGRLVEDIFEKTTYADKSIKLKGSGDYWYDIDIKSIVTKEQFENISYRVEE